MQQDKHVIILHCEEDREVFINKLKFPKTVFHVGNNPQPGDIVVDKKFGYQRLFATWILDHYDNLPEYVILTQAIPGDHVVEPLIAMDCTFTNSWGSFAYARSMYNQWSTNWVKIMPIREIAHFLGCGFHNDNNVSKNLYYFHPGEIFYVSRKKLLEKPKSFYEKIIMLDNKEFYFEFLKSDPKPNYFWNDILKYHPELNGLPKEDKLKRLENLEWNIERDFGFSGLIFETLWFYIWADKNLFDTIDTAQASIGNELYFNTKLDKYDADFRFYPFPYHPSIQQSMMNFRLLENDWFDWNCPNYLKWREALIHQTVLEGESKGFDGLKYIKQLEQYGIKHISF